MPPSPTPLIACQQVLLQDGSVFSVQWLDIPGGAALPLRAPALLERYLETIPTFTCSLVRPMPTSEGIEFRLFGSLSLLSFSPPQFISEENREKVQLSISGGLLLQPGKAGRGSFTLSVSRGGDRLRVTLQLSDYFPRLLHRERPPRVCRWIYRFTQAYIHKVLTVSFLTKLYRELTGASGSLAVTEVQVREGTST